MSKNYFDQIESNLDLPQLEKGVVEFWEKEQPVKKLKKLRENSPRKVYYDGPITSNGLPHYGHAVTWVLKDAVPRFWTMTGHQVLRNMGWDCQGLPVEYEVEKDLGFERKDDIEKFGVAKFNDLCRQSVLKYQDSMFKYETLVGRWYDLEEIYSTMEPDYIESMWWSLAELYKKGLLYEGYKVVPYSTRAGTPLSSHEVNDGGYSDIEDPFVTVKFKLKSEDNTYVLAWTTTPWTVPGNLMLAVGKDINYVKVNFDGANYILAEARLEEVFKGKTYEKIADVKSEDLVGLEYDPPFNFFEEKRSEGAFKIIASSHANTEDGTGIVHLAPYGEEDFKILTDLGISLFDYLDEVATFTDMVVPYKGMFYKKANKQIISDLESSGSLFATGTLVHRMPMCWRTGTPLIYKPIKSWYVAVSKFKDALVKNNANLNWYPEHLKNGNSKIWLENARDWALSRNRYWGTPLPVWVNDKTGEKVVIGSFAELEKLSSVKLPDPHRPYVDEVAWSDGNGGTYRRVKDVIDVWYDSGSMPFARFHYPFENKEKFEENFPADYIAEGPDQVRLWFYVMHVLGQALFDKCPYKTIVTNGTLLDEKGKKLSKSKKNYKPLDEVLSVYGGDILRYFILTSTITAGQDAIFTEEVLRNSLKDFFLPFWNCMRYFTTNANIVGFDPKAEYKAESVLDKWVLAKLQDTVNKVHENMAAYNLMDAARSLSSFVNEFSTWYVRRSRDVIKNGDKASLFTYFTVLREFTFLMASYFPFFAEIVFDKLKLKDLTGLHSVHYGLVPAERVLTQQENDLLAGMEKVRMVVEKAHALRKEKGVALRQPLNEVKVKNYELDVVYFDILKDELNVKNVTVESGNGDLEVDLDLVLTPLLKKEGEARELVRKIQEERKNLKTDLDELVEVSLPEFPEEFEDYIKKSALVAKLTKGDFKVVRQSS